MNEPGQWHLYAYCANNPINYVDPSGHFVMALPALVFGGIATVVVKVSITVVLAGVTYTVAAKAYEKIKNQSRKRNSYYRAKYKDGNVYIAYSNGSISKRVAANRIKNGLSVYTYKSSNAKEAMNTANRGRTKAEIHLHKGSVSFYHYHTARRNGAHMWFGRPYTK